MIKVGDKVVVVDGDYSGMPVGEVLEVSEKEHDLGFWAKTVNDELYYVRTSDMRGNSSVIVKPYTETEAEKRGAKFGVMGIYKPTGKHAIVVSTSKVNTPDPLPRQERWIVCIEGSIATHEVYAENIRLDHEPEYVAWADAPEHLRYDASRVYFDGKPVKWVAKPEGAWSEVAYVDCDRMVKGSPDALMVKL